MPGLLIAGGATGQVAPPADTRRAADLAEVRRKHELLPEFLEFPTATIITGTSGGTCTNYQITEIISAATGTGLMTNTWPIWNINYTATSNSSITYAACNYGRNGGWPFTSTTTISNANYGDILAWHALNDRYERIKEAGAAAENIQRYSRRKLSETELLAALEQEKAARVAAEKRALAAKMAEKRADELLRLCLSPQQIDDFEKKNCFYVEVAGRDSSKPKERYRIDRGSHGNVKQVDAKGSIIRSFCIQPTGVPVADVLLTQKLWLEASEETREEFWATANITPLMVEKNIPHTVPRHERRKYAEAHGLLH